MPQAPGVTLRAGTCSASPSPSHEASERGNGFCFIILLIFNWRRCLRSHCRGWGPACLPCACRGRGLLWVLLASALDPAEPKPLPALPRAPLPVGSALGCSLPHLPLAAVLRSPLLRPVARHGAQPLGAARAGCCASRSQAGGAGGCPALPSPACCPQLPPTSLGLLAGRAAHRGKVRSRHVGQDRQTDRQTAATTYLSAAGAVSVPPALALLRAALCPD